MSNFVMEEEDGEIVMMMDKHSGNQRFKLEKYTNNAYYLKTTPKGDKALTLDATMKYKPFDPKALNQLFSIVPVSSSTPLTETCIMVNAHSNKVIDVPGGTF